MLVCGWLWPICGTLPLLTIPDMFTVGPRVAFIWPGLRGALIVGTIDGRIGPFCPMVPTGPSSCVRNTLGPVLPEAPWCCCWVGKLVSWPGRLFCPSVELGILVLAGPGMLG